MRDDLPPAGGLSQATPMQRSRGAAAVGLAPGPRGPRITRLAQSGSAKAFLPRVHAVVPEVVFLNTSGGLTGGDRLSYAVDLGAGVAAAATTQTAERAYASTEGHGTVEVNLSVGPGATLHWLPQETILFDRSALHRRTRVEMAADARCVMVETVVLGRAAMGERVERLDLLDRREVHVAGRSVLIDPLRILRPADAGGEGGAGLDGATALATLAVIGAGAEATETPLRAEVEALPEGVRAAVSAWSGKCVLRAMAPDAFALRGVMARCIRVATGQRLPVVWSV